MHALPTPPPGTFRARWGATRWGVLGAGLIAALGSACADDPPAREPRGPAVEAVQVPAQVEAVLEKAECLTCHVLAGRGSPLGPDLTRVGTRLSAEGIRAKILDPSASVAEGYENLSGTMPSDFRDRLTDEEIGALVRHLAGGS